jgi:hypothetical protein
MASPDQQRAGLLGNDAKLYSVLRKPQFQPVMMTPQGD